MVYIFFLNHLTIHFVNLNLTDKISVSKENNRKYEKKEYKRKEIIKCKRKNNILYGKCGKQRITS